MREDIGLFRGKRLDNGEWVEGYLVVTPEDKEGKEFAYWIISGLDYIDSIYDAPMAAELVDPATVGEYVGLKDEYGERIFEGDIVEMLYNDGYSEVGEIAWSTGLLRYVFLEREGAGCHIYSIDTTCKMEWLATIHDNPELLEV